jgi:hypothetical protein
VLALRRGIHVQYTLPDLVEQILPEATPALEQRLELHWLRVTDERRHLLKATAPRCANRHDSQPALHPHRIETAADPPQRPDQPHVPDVRPVSPSRPSA